MYTHCCTSVVDKITQNNRTEESVQTPQKNTHYMWLWAKQHKANVLEQKCVTIHRHTVRTGVLAPVARSVARTCNMNLNTLFVNYLPSVNNGFTVVGCWTDLVDHVDLLQTD